MAYYEKWEKIYKEYSVGVLPWELGKPRPVLVNLIEGQKIIPEGKALDLCCGLGTNTIYLSKAGFQTTAIDISETAVKHSKERSLEADANIHFITCNSVYLPFKDEVFNFVFDMGCFHHILPNDRQRFVLGIRRVLKERGHYFMVCFSDKNGTAWNHFSKESIVAIFSPYFGILDIHHFSSLEGDGYIRSFYATLLVNE